MLVVEEVEAVLVCWLCAGRVRGGAGIQQAGQPGQKMLGWSRAIVTAVTGDSLTHWRLYS